MVTRRFNKKRSVYEALANKSGLDFSPFIHRQPYWERREVFEDDAAAKKHFGRSRGNSLPSEARDSGGPRSLPVCSNIIEMKDSDSHAARVSSYRYRRSSQPSQSDCIPTIPEKHSMISPKDRSLSPPSIPTRDSSLRYRANPAHEKYPSWPVTSEVAEVSSQVSSSSYRSNSWTQPTDYPKEPNASYSRPKKLYQISTQQLHPVQEKTNDSSTRCTKSEAPSHIPRHQHEDAETLNAYSSEQGLTEAAISKYFNSEEAYHQSNNSGRFQSEREYNTHSPPERDTSVFDRGRDSNKFYDEESYTKKYGDMLRYYSQSPALYGNWSKDSPHGPVCDSNVVCDSNTPLLDRLRLEKQSHPPAWPPPVDTDTPSESGTCTDSVDSNSSSQETLKWHGSYNDLSSLNARVSSMPADYDSDQSTIADTGCLTPQMTAGSTSPEGSHKSFVTVQPDHFVRSPRVEPMPGHDKETVSFCVSGHKRELKASNAQEVEKPTRQSSFSNHVTSSHCSPSNGTSSYENRIQKLKQENKSRGVSQAFQTSFPGFSRSAFDETHEAGKLQSLGNSRVTSDSTPSSSKTCDSGAPEKNHFSTPHSNFTPERRDPYSSGYSSHCWTRPKADDRKEGVHYLDSHKRHRISDPELKAIQKQAVLSFYHRQTALESGDFSDAKSDRSVNSFSPLHHQSSDTAVFSHPSSSSSSSRSPASKEKPFLKKPNPALPPKPKHHYSSGALEKCPVRHQANFLKDSFPPKDSCHEAPPNIKQSYSSEKLEKSPVSPSKRKPSTNESSLLNTAHVGLAAEHQHPFLNESAGSSPPVSPVRPKPSVSLDRNTSLQKPSYSKLHPASPDNKKKDAFHDPVSPIGQAPTIMTDSDSLKSTHFSTIAENCDIQPGIQEAPNCNVPDVIYENVVSLPPAAKSAHSSRELKDRTVDQASSHGFLWSHPGGRKAHLKKIYSSNETAVVKVISSEGETLVETVETQDNPQHVVKPRVPPKCVNKTSPLVPSPPHDAVLPESCDLSLPAAVIQDPEEDEELRQIEDSLQNQIKLSMLASASSSPDLPLPPPPPNTDTEVLHTDDPLPPPPLEITEAEFLPKTEQRSFVSEPTAVSFSLSYHHHHHHHNQSDNCKPPSSPHSMPETPVLAVDANSSLIITQSAAKDFPHDTDVPNSNCQSWDRDFVEGDYPKLSEVPTLVQEPCVPHQSQCLQSEKSEKTLDGEVPKMDKEKMEEEALYANLDLLRHHMRNGDTYGFVANGLEQIPVVSTAIIVTNSATQTSDSTPSLPRKQTKTGKSQAELECERLSRDFVKSFGDAALRNLLLPSPNHKTMSDYMEGLLDLELEKGGKPTTRPSLSSRTSVPDHVVHSTNINTFRDNGGLPLTSAYFTTSEPKAKLLTRYCHNLESKDWTNEVELKDRKEELIASIGKKLEILRFEQVALQDEVNQNEQLGGEVAVKVQQLAKPNELEKFRLHVEELEKIINLLLSLSGRLARAQNALLILPKEAKPEERCILEAKRDKLYEQHEEARRLKESIDRRSHQVSQFLHDYLTKDEYADYDHFIKMKSKLLMDARELDEKIKLGEEQLAALRGSMDTHFWSGPTLDLHSQTIVNRT